MGFICPLQRATTHPKLRNSSIIHMPCFNSGLILMLYFVPRASSNLLMLQAPQFELRNLSYARTGSFAALTTCPFVFLITIRKSEWPNFKRITITSDAWPCIPVKASSSLVEMILSSKFGTGKRIGAVLKRLKAFTRTTSWPWPLIPRTRTPLPRLLLIVPSK